MTYPNQYQQTPGYPQPAQMHPGQQFAQPTSVAQPAVPALGFQDPSRGAGAGNPGPRHLIGRTIVMVPKRIDKDSKYDGQARPTAYADLYVIDGGPITYGDSEDKASPRPPTHVIETPAFFPNAMIGNQAFVTEIESKLGPNGQPTGLSVGVVVKPDGKRYYAMTPCATDERGNDRPDGAARRAAAQDIYMRKQSGEWIPPLPVPLGQAAPPVQPGTVSYAQPPQQPQYAQYAPQSAPPVQMQPQGAPAPGMPPPPGWEGNPAWGQFTTEQQLSIWQQSSGPAAAAPTTPGALGGNPAW